MLINDFEILILDLLTKLDNVFKIVSINGASIVTWLWWCVTQFGDKFILLGVILLFYWCINKEKGEKIAFSVILSLCINSLLKFFVNRERPFLYANKKYAHIRKLEGLDGAGGTSFPSGHSQNASSLFTSVALHERNLFTFILALTIISLVPISRVYLGVHYPTDTIVGVILGILISYLSFILMKYCYRQKFIFYIGFLVLMSPFLFINPSAERAEQIFASFGLFFGAVMGILLENKCINFTCEVSVGKKILRFFVGTVILVATYLLYSLIKSFIPGVLWVNIFRCFGYALIAFIAFGIIPFMFKKEKR